MKKKRIIGLTTLVLFITAAIMLTCNGRLEHEDASQEAAVKAIDTVPMLITQVQQCAKLYTAEYRVHKIVTHDDVVRPLTSRCHWATVRWPSLLTQS